LSMRLKGMVVRVPVNVLESIKLMKVNDFL